MDQTNNNKTPSNPLFAPSNKLSWKDPFRWLQLGFQDYKNARKLSVWYGGFFAIGGLLLSLLVLSVKGKILMLSMMLLFILLGPLFAFGLYDIPRQLERGIEPTLRHSIQQIKGSAPNQWVFAVVVIVIGLLWMRAATIIHVFYPEDAEPSLEALLTFFMVGTGAGVFFAGLVFGISAFSLPMMVDRNVDAISASLSSLSAVMNNMWVCALWAFLIFALIAVGFATLYLGLIIVLPVIGYATWHGYQDAIKKA